MFDVLLCSYCCQLNFSTAIIKLYCVILYGAWCDVVRCSLWYMLLLLLFGCNVICGSFLVKGDRNSGQVKRQVEYEERQGGQEQWSGEETG